MCVPWPKRSRPSRSAVRSTRARSRAPRLGLGVTPVSIDATAPVSPSYFRGTVSRPIARCHADSAGSPSKQTGSFGEQSRTERMRTRASLQSPATARARRSAARPRAGTRAAKAPASGRRRPTLPPARCTARSASADAGTRSTTTTRCGEAKAAWAPAGEASRPVAIRAAATAARTPVGRRGAASRPGGMAGTGPPGGDAGGTPDAGSARGRMVVGARAAAPAGSRPEGATGSRPRAGIPCLRPRRGGDRESAIRPGAGAVVSSMSCRSSSPCPRPGGLGPGRAKP
jgi:hypothetical protein